MASLDFSSCSNDNGRLRTRSTNDCQFYHYALKKLDRTEGRGEKSIEVMERMNRTTLEASWTENVQGAEAYVKTDSLSEGLKARWTTSILAKLYPGFSESIKAVTKLSISILLALFVTLGTKTFQKVSAVLLTDGNQNSGE